MESFSKDNLEKKKYSVVATIVAVLIIAVAFFAGFFMGGNRNGQISEVLG